jgi:hypothetical protein
MNAYESRSVCVNIFLFLVTIMFVVFFFVAEVLSLIVIMSREFDAERISVSRFQRSVGGHR